MYISVCPVLFIYLSSNRDLSSNRLSSTVSPKIGNLINLKRLNLGHNVLHGAIPNEIERLTKLESLTLNYNSMNGQFPSTMAPPALGYCYMTPNQFQSCPDQSVITNPQSLSFQCSVDCMVRTKKKSTANTSQRGYTTTFLAALFMSVAVGYWM